MSERLLLKSALPSGTLPSSPQGSLPTFLPTFLLLTSTPASLPASLPPAASCIHPCHSSPSLPPSHSACWAGLWLCSPTQTGGGGIQHQSIHLPWGSGLSGSNPQGWRGPSPAPALLSGWHGAAHVGLGTHLGGTSGTCTAVGRAAPLGQPCAPSTAPHTQPEPPSPSLPDTPGMGTSDNYGFHGAKEGF